METRHLVRVVVLRTGAALVIGGLAASGAVGIDHAVSGRTTAVTATHSAPAGAVVPARHPEDDFPSQPPADEPPSDGEIAYHTFFRAFTNVPNNEERVVHCGANFPHILFGWGLVIPTLAGQQTSSHAVFNPDGWAFAARGNFSRTVSFNVFAVCADKAPG